MIEFLLLYNEVLILSGLISLCFPGECECAVTVYVLLYALNSS